MNRADPNLTLISHLLSLGYTTDQISEAQETLWNTVGSGEGGYDDVVAVERLLKQLYEDVSSSEDETDSEEELKGGSGELFGADLFYVCYFEQGYYFCTEMNHLLK
jgi:hypothetical protein